MIEKVKAYAKINLSLDVIKKRSDGYHDLKSVMQSVSLADDITIETACGGGIIVTTDNPKLSTNRKNIACKAAELFFKHAGTAPNLHIHIEKKIPIGAGLGGGSADAGAVLCALNTMYGYPVSMDNLLSIGLECGADVPFCMRGGTFLAEGLGEILTPLSPLPDCIILIAKPVLSISTKSVFESFDLKAMKAHPSTEGIIENLSSGNLAEIGIRLYNVFEENVRPKYKDLDKIKGIMLDLGALGSSMTGTGSAVFGIFTDESKARDAQSKFQRNKIQAFITAPVREF